MTGNGKTARDIEIHFQLQNAILFPRIHKTLEINNNIKEGGVILFLIKRNVSWKHKLNQMIK
jgi:hypothetical protein